MGDGRATVQQDTLVSIGNRCHNTFHLHLHTGRKTVELGRFRMLGADGRREEEEEDKLRLKAFPRPQLQAKENKFPVVQKGGRL